MPPRAATGCRGRVVGQCGSEGMLPTASPSAHDTKQHMPGPKQAQGADSIRNRLQAYPFAGPFGGRPDQPGGRGAAAPPPAGGANGASFLLIVNVYGPLCWHLLRLCSGCACQDTCTPILPTLASHRSFAAAWRCQGGALHG